MNWRVGARCGMATRRLLLGGAAAAGGAAMLAALGCERVTQPAARGPTTLPPASLVWIKGTGADRIQQGYDKTAEAFAQLHPSVKVEPILPSGDFFEKVRIMLAGGSPVDVVWTSPVWIGALPKQGIVRDLSAFVSRDKTFDKSDFFPAALQSFEWDNKPHAMPCFLYYFCLFYNRDSFKAAGLKPPDTTWTWSTFLETATRLSSQRGGEERFGLVHSNDLNNLLPWIRSHGGKVFDHPQYPKRTLMDAKAIEALQFMYDLRFKHRVVPTREQLGGLSLARMFAAGRVAMWAAAVITGTPVLEQQPFDADVTYLPKGAAGRKNVMSLTGHGITPSTKYPDQSWEFLKFISAKGIYDVFTRDEIDFGLPAVKSVAGKDYLEYKTPPSKASRKLLVDGIASVDVLPKHEKMLDLYSPIFTKHLNEIFLNGGPPKATAEQLRDAANAVMVG
ncbi:MAG: sugar ABC transporter substrate-binding protein [Chloroflexi bacterium]|nr:sugar ABC transporter substrate-binding protein [Chloroflexota bacterium]